jgi:ribosome-associated protein
MSDLSLQLQQALSQLPVSSYFDTPLYAREMHLLFKQGPRYIGHSLSVPEVGESTARELGQRHRSFAELADSKKAENIVILDMRGIVDYTDYLIICTGRTPRQTKAIADEVRHGLKKDHGAEIRRVEGDKEGDWILVDALDVVVHVFTPEARDFYRLDRLWREAPQERFESTPA